MIDALELQFNISDADRENIFKGYEGEEPPANLRMVGVLKRMYLTLDKDNQPLLKVLYQVTGGDYEGYAAWDNVSLTPKAAFKWAALCDDVLKVEVEDLAKRMRLDRESETGAGIPVESIGDLFVQDIPVHFAVSYRSHTDKQTNAVTRQTQVHFVEALEA